MSYPVGTKVVIIADTKSEGISHHKIPIGTLCRIAGYSPDWTFPYKIQRLDEPNPEPMSVYEEEITAAQPNFILEI